MGSRRQGVDLKETIAVKIGGAWAVAGALWVRFYAGLVLEIRALPIMKKPSILPSARNTSPPKYLGALSP